jgi:hypothetical protein
MFQSRIRGLLLGVPLSTFRIALVEGEDPEYTVLHRLQPDHRAPTTMVSFAPLTEWETEEFGREARKT